MAAGSILPSAGVFPKPVLDVVVASLAARAAMAGTSLGVFRALEELPDDARGLASRLELDELGLDVLLVTLRSMGYLRRDRAGRYRNTRVTRRYLVPQGERPLDAWIGGAAYDNWDHLGQLERVIRGGDPVGLHERPFDDPYWERYEALLTQAGALSAKDVAAAIPAERPRRLLDLAGGPGQYAIAMCRRHPGLVADVAELEPAARAGRRLVEEAGMSDRIRYRVGDLFEADLPTGYDLVTAHSVLHTLPPERCRELVGIARGALRPGGLLAINELERPGDGDPGTVLGSSYGLLFYVLGRTRTYTAAEMAGWMEDAGFRDVRVARPPMAPGTALLTGVA